MNAPLSALSPFARNLRRFQGHLAGGLGLALATQACGLALLGVSGWFLTGCGLAGVSATLAEAYDVVSPSGAIRALSLGRTGFRWGERVVTHDATFRLIGALRVWMYERLARLSPRQTGGLHSGEVLGRLTKDIDALDNLYQKLLVPSLAALVLAVGVTAFAAAVSPVLAAPLILLLGLVFLASPVLGWRLGARISPRLVSGLGSLRRVVLDTLDALDDLDLHAPARERQNQIVAQKDGARLGLQARLHRLSSAARALTALAAGLCAWAVLGLASSVPGIDGTLLVGLALTIPGLAETLGALPAVWLELPGTAEAAQRLTRLTGQAPRPAYPDASSSTPQGNDLVLRAVGFRYHADEPLLNDLTCSVPEGTHIVLSGPSGGGKTTLVRLLTRLEDPTEGCIELGGVALPELDETTLRARVGCASQDAWMFTDTLAANLRLASETASEEQLWRVLEVAGLADTVRQWPQGLQTWVEEGGKNLSGGQHRRLGVARALLRNAPVTILDEPTEGLDDSASQTLARAVRSYLQGKTLVWVSHKPIDRQEFEVGWVLESGQLTEASPQPTRTKTT